MPVLAYPCLDCKGKITYSRHLKFFILQFRALLFQMVGGSKAEGKLTSSSALTPPTVQELPEKHASAFCFQGISDTAHVWPGFDEKCVPGTKDLLFGDQPFRSWLFHGDIYLHPLWNKTFHLSCCNTTQLLQPSDYLRGKYSTDKFFPC